MAARKKKRASVPKKSSLETELERIESAGGGGMLRVGSHTLKVSNLGKIYFPAIARTKGDVMRYYDRAAPWLLPVIDGRPLVLKRFPGGVNGPPFFQQNAAVTPAGVRVELVPAEDAPGRRVVGGDLMTQLYCVQLGAIEVNPWHSRIGSLQCPDYTILDLDPGPKAPFRTIVRVALELKTLLDASGVYAGIKTSGSRGLHIVIPLPPRTNEEAAQLVSHVFAQRVTELMPKDATVVRSRAGRPDKAVYVDYLQNIVGKSVACAFSIRARPTGTVSMPLDWAELTDKLDPSRFTMDMTSSDLGDRGKLWHAATARRNTLKKFLSSSSPAARRRG